MIFNNTIVYDSNFIITNMRVCIFFARLSVCCPTCVADAVDKGEYRHYMLKEIYEQPNAIAETLEGRFIGNK
jgi:glucosamine 6-phosphate synthetase-like amidotransferase/phosphosugar isomerase protein